MYNFSKVIGLLLSIPYFLGIVMFFDINDGIFFNIFMFSTPMALFIGSMTAERYFKNITINNFSMLLLISGLANGIRSLYRDITIVNGPDYPALVFRTIVVVALFVLLKKVLSYRKGNEEK